MLQVLQADSDDSPSILIRRLHDIAEMLRFFFGPDDSWDDTLVLAGCFAMLDYHFGTDTSSIRPLVNGIDTVVRETITLFHDDIVLCGKCMV